MRQKTFGKWLAAAGILIVMTIWMVLPALAAPTVNSIRITFKDKYEDPGVIEEPEISCGQLRDRDHIRGVEQGCRKMESWNESDGNADSFLQRKRVLLQLRFKVLPDLRCDVE